MKKTYICEIYKIYMLNNFLLLILWVLISHSKRASLVSEINKHILNFILWLGTVLLSYSHIQFGLIIQDCVWTYFPKYEASHVLTIESHAQVCCCILFYSHYKPSYMLFCFLSFVLACRHHPASQADEERTSSCYKSLL